MENQKSKLQGLKLQLEKLFENMPSSHEQIRQRNKVAFELSRAIEKLEDPKSYKENSSNWENHELTF